MSDLELAHRVFGRPMLAGEGVDNATVEINKAWNAASSLLHIMQ